jgi:hypothetical protein
MIEFWKKQHFSKAKTNLGIMTQAMITVPLLLMTGNNVKPLDYINYARRDIAEGDSRGRINALSNVKRAIDCQMDVILEAYGLLKLSINEKWSFPKKIEVIRKIGIVSPSILNLINSRRNELEHHHRKPKRKEVAEFVDIAELFVELFRSMTHRTEVLIDYDSDFAFFMDLEQNVIHIYDKTKMLLESGGIERFKQTVKENSIRPIQRIPISDLDAWTEACGRYIRR